MIDSDDPNLRRLSIRSWRRGMKEMDLILGPWSDAHLSTLEAAEIAAYESLLQENDQDLYAWISGVEDAPATHAELIDRIGRHARAVNAH